MTIAESISKYLELSGITLKDLAVRAGTSAGYLHDCIHGRRNFTVSMTKRLADAMKVPSFVLVTDVPDEVRSAAVRAAALREATASALEADAKILRGWGSMSDLEHHPNDAA